jgi:4-oxalocrotonate tautomerase
MPIIEVTLVEGRSPEKKEALVEALTDAVERAIAAPRESVRVILREIPAAHFAVGGVSFERRRREAGQG